MFGQGEFFLAGDFLLPLFYQFVVELFDTTAPDAYQMVMVSPAIEFENGIAPFEVVAFYESRRFELGEHPVYRGEPDLLAVGDQRLVDFLRRQVPIRAVAVFEHFEDLDAWERDLESRITDVLSFHGGFARCLKLGYRVSFIVGFRTLCIIPCENRLS